MKKRVWAERGALRARQEIGRSLLTDPALCPAALRRETGGIKGLAHITGGGITDTRRVACPKGWMAKSISTIAAAGVPWLAKSRYRRTRDAAHLQLRHRHGGCGRRRMPTVIALPKSGTRKLIAGTGGPSRLSRGSALKSVAVPLGRGSNLSLIEAAGAVTHHPGRFNVKVRRDWKARARVHCRRLIPISARRGSF